MTRAPVGVLAGRRALERSDWESARAAFTAVLEQASAEGPLAPEAEEGLGLALWFLGEVAEGILARERAVEGYLTTGRCDAAARLAVWVSHQHMLGGRASAARGWLARAERAAADGGSTGSGAGWVAVERARHATGVHEQVTLARRAVRIARATGQTDLEVFALSLLGRAVVGAGRKEEGLRLLEEAMAAASAGRARDVHTLAEAYCNLIEGCATAGEWERGAEWCELVDAFARDHRTAPLLGACRAIHAEVLIATGHWEQAEQALDAALTTHSRYVPQMAAPALATLAELRVRQGRLLDAEHLLTDRELDLASLRALAQLRLAEGRAAEAVELLERGLRTAGESAVRAAQLLGPLVQAHLQCGDPAAASAAATRLAELADTTSMRLLQATADLAAARVQLARGLPDDASTAAASAVERFAALAMPYEEARARLELARSLAARYPVQAHDEVRAALAAFRELGATRAADAAAELLRVLGHGTAPRQRCSGSLTVREQEVLDLVALGMTNAGIATALLITEKTAGHHVSRILTKLGVRNRTQAAAHARGTVEISR